MREMFHLVFVLCFAVNFIIYVDGMFTVSCPMGCTANQCTMGVGCPLGMCMPGWCGKHGGRNVGMICVPTCSPGQFCLQEPFKMCADCRVRNCKSCKERDTCDACDRGYKLNPDKSECRRG
ncbi:hypothetical protein ACJMK2_013573 [Sinanodonta woodiana]|uniref:Uncharacterized protein n=1 Tax=Sinanodonta woodiana TaxID=1069815 RepID=A0ABD3UXY6_SINWO